MPGELVKRNYEAQASSFRSEIRSVIGAPGPLSNFSLSNLFLGKEFCPIRAYLSMRKKALFFFILVG